MKFLTVILVLLCCCPRLVAFPKDLYQSDMQHLTQENGLANNTLYTLHQDKNGFLWLGTDVGISRYDGVHFHNYELIDIEPQAVQRICEMEQDNLLWLELGRYHHIACFDKTIGEYVTLTNDSSDVLSTIYDLCIADSTLYALTPRGIERMDYKRNKQTIQVASELVVAHRYPLKKLVGDNNFLYALDKGNNLLIYNYRTGNHRVVRYNRFQTKKNLNDIKAMNGCLWVMSDWNGTYCYNAEQDELRTLELSKDKSEEHLISHVAMKNDSTFLACTPNSILRISFAGTDYIHNPIEVSAISFDQFKYESFIKNRITDLFVDNKNNVNSSISA